MAAIGGFQFDNLVQGRIPFLFLNLGVDTSAVYPHVFKMHLERLQLIIEGKELAIASSDEIIAEIRKIKFPTSAALVVLDLEGERSVALAEALEKSGFTNVFFVRGGWKQLLIEKESGF